MYVCIKTEEVEEIKDLGVHYDTLLLFIIIFSLFWRIKLLACLLDKHVSENVKKAYSMLGIIKRNLELFKIIKGIYDPSCVPHIDLLEFAEDSIKTRGNKYKLTQHHCHYDLRKYNFTNRVIPIWNSLPTGNHVVSAETVNTFKQRLDKFWIDQDVMYNYKADLHGIGNRSIIV